MKRLAPLTAMLITLLVLGTGCSRDEEVSGDGSFGNDDLYEGSSTNRGDSRLTENEQAVIEWFKGIFD